MNKELAFVVKVKLNKISSEYFVSGLLYYIVKEKDTWNPKKYTQRPYPVKFRKEIWYKKILFLRK